MHVLSLFLTHYLNFEMPKTTRKAYDAAFKLKAISLAVEKGNRAVSRELGINECMIRRWRQQRKILEKCKKSSKALRGNKCLWPELENELEDWVNTQRAGGRGVSTTQIRLKAATLAREMGEMEDFQGGPSWRLRFMRRKGLSVRARTTLCQQLPSDHEEKLANFRDYISDRIKEHCVSEDSIINMDEVPLTFDMPLTKTVNEKGDSSINIKTTGHKKTHFTCVLACTASGEKLPPMVIFKRITMPKDKLPKGIIVKVHKKGWMDEGLMLDWIRECYVKRPGGFFHVKKAILVMDSMRAHLTDAVKEAVKGKNSIPTIIPGGTTKFLQPLDISVNRPFKVALRAQWEKWMTSGEKSFTKTGRMRRATFTQVCEWIISAWRKIAVSTIENGFRKACIVTDVNPAACSEVGSASDSNSDSDSEGEGGMLTNDAILQLFHSDTEDEEFEGFDEGDIDE